jgi:surface carbohydrate biosynthesis protein
MKTIALPIENKVREFDGKLWLGLNLTERDYEVVLGPSWEIKSVIDVIAPDLYFTKDPGDGNKIYDKLHSSGVLVCGFSPESGVNSKIENYARNRKESIHSLDVYFAWGEEPAAAVRSMYTDSNVTDKIEVTGNPRFDLLREGLNDIYAGSEAKIRDEYGDFILMNTSFGLANASDRERLIELIRKNQPQRNPIEEERVALRVLYSFLELVLYLSDEDIGRNIVLRPHPGEDHSTYERIFGDHETVHIKHEGDVRSWIHAADGVIHHDCTTGIEAALMKKPVLSYQPLTDLPMDQTLSQVASETRTTREDVKQWITDVAASGQEYTLTEHQKSQIRQYFPNIDQLATPQICDKVDSLLAESDGFTGHDISIQQELERRIKASPIGMEILDLYDYVRDILTQGGHRKSRSKQRQKFSGLEYKEIAKRSKEMTDVGEMSGVVIEPVPLTRYTYRLRKSE